MADRRLIRARAHEPTGEVESLRGRTDIGRMGDRIESTATATESIGAAGQSKRRPREIMETLQRKKQKLDQSTNVPTHQQNRKESVALTSGGQTILDLDNLTGYQPTTPSARAAYETLLVSFIRRVFHLHFLHLTPCCFRPLSAPKHFWGIKPLLF